jgi:hypothetical protein
MACILKAPAGEAPGVVSFTTQERDRWILRDGAIGDAVRALKERWLVGLHHNWHDFHFRYDPTFDFSMAGEDDLRRSRLRPFPLVPLDACNFVPSYLRPSPTEKFWDVLYVAHPVSFKRVDVFMRMVRSLYDQGQRLRVLHICPVAEGHTDDPRPLYEELFPAKEEQDLFTLLTLDFRYPFPFDLPTLAHFYRSSKVFVHTALDERRCRVAAYAWACGSPVVGTAAIGSLLPRALRREPFFYKVRGDEDYAPLAARAVAEYEPREFEEVRATVSVDHTPALFERHVAQVAAERGRALSPQPLAAHDLDIRLGRHHGMGHNPNSVPQTVADLLRYLRERPDEAIARDLEHADPELHIAGLEAFASTELPDPPEPLVPTLGPLAKVRDAVAVARARRA